MNAGTDRHPVSSRPTMKSIAEHLGISRQLVSIVLRDQPGASARTRRRVRSAARELGYYPDASAQALRGKRTRRLGVIFTARQPFEADLVEHLFNVARNRGFTLVLAPLTPERGRDAVIEEILSQRVEGALILAAPGGAATFEGLPQEVPCVMLGGPRSSESLDDVRVDDELGTRMVVEHLVALGHRRITYVTGGHGPNSAERTRAYLDAMAENGLEPCVEESEYTEVAGYKAACRILSTAERPTAVVGGNDRIALGVLGTLVRRGVAVPENMSVAGFDDAFLARLPFVELTTVAYDPAGLAERAVTAILNRIDRPDTPATSYRQTPRLVPRSSTAAPAS